MQLASAVVVTFVLATSSIGAAKERDYEAEARALYGDQPEYETSWPVEFHLRIVEGLTQDIERALLDLGKGLERFASPSATKTLKGLISDAEFLDRARLIAKTGVVSNDKFETTVAFEIAGLETTGQRKHERGRATAVFSKVAGRWQLESMVLIKTETERRDGFGFSDVTRSWLGQNAFKRLSKISVSDRVHEDLVSGRSTDLQPVAMDAHPGAAVIDIDDDGWEDLVVWDVQGEAVYLRNDRGRFTTNDNFPALRNVSALVSADLDNDGYRDLVVGRFFSVSSILWGQAAGGYTLDRTELPSSVASISLADVDHDGRLDLFFATASHSFHGRHRPPSGTKQVDANVGRIGPANVLMRNLGERRWQDVTNGSGLRLYRSTLQAAFIDVDRDGFPELLLGNDFAPASFYRNRGGRFTEASAEFGIDKILFGMGISVGDANGDEYLDAFVSAMSSSAGRRVVGDGSALASSIPAWGRRARALAHRGNTLLLGSGDGTLVDQSTGVRDANWAYGGIFIDADSSGTQDLYVPNGFLTSRLEPRGTTRDL